MNKPIQLTEQDIHFLVEDAVKNILRENGMEEGIWGGLKNVWQGAKQGNLNVASTYKTGNWASSFAKYEQQVQQIIQKMQQVANNSGNQEIASSLDNISMQFSQAAANFNKMAQNAANTKPQVNTQVQDAFAQPQQQSQGNAQQQQAPQQPQGNGQSTPPRQQGSYNPNADRAEMPESRIRLTQNDIRSLVSETINNILRNKK